MVPIEVAPTPGERRTTAPLHVVEDRTPVRKLEFVEVGSSPAAPRRRPAAGAGAGGVAGAAGGVAGAAGGVAGAAGAGPETAVSAETPVSAEYLVPTALGEPRWSLWSDAEV